MPYKQVALLSFWVVYIAAFRGGAAWCGPTASVAETPSIRLSNNLRIVSIQASRQTDDMSGLAVANETTDHPRPPVAGFSPLVAITTSDKRSTDDFDFEHALTSTYTGRALKSPAEENFVVGILDTGSVVDLVAGSYADALGLAGPNLTTVEFPIGGVSGMLNALITKPVGIFAAGLGAVKTDGTLDLSQVVGHTNVAALASPPISCDNGEEITAVVGTPMLAFYTTVIRVDRQRMVIVGNRTYISPDVRILDFYSPSPAEYPRSVPIELGGLAPVTTASYYAFPNLDDIFGEMEPLTPTLLSMSGLSIPTGGAFFAEMGVLQGEPGPLNTIQNMRVLVDTGAQSSIISSSVAARLNLPVEPDFTAQVCGIGGLSEAPGYYVDYARVNALGGALEFSRVPFVLLDVESQEGGPLDGVLGMNFFWNRNVVLEPTVAGAAFLHLSEPISYAFIDLNFDGVVDVADFAIFASAWHSTPDDPEWNRYCDLFIDEVVDARDLQAFVDAWVNTLQP